MGDVAGADHLAAGAGVDDEVAAGINTDGAPAHLGVTGQLGADIHAEGGHAVADLVGGHGLGERLGG